MFNQSSYTKHNNAINDYKQLDFMELRENIYKIFIYQQDIFFFLFQLLKCNVQKKTIHAENICNIILKLTSFLTFFNNNYRPIYHLESFIMYLCKVIHDF